MNWRLAVHLLATFGLTLVAGFITLPWIQKHHLGQTVRADGPKSHLKKSGTPTFGGVFFLLAWLAVLILRLVTMGGQDAYLPIFLLIFAYAAVGAADDFTKVRIDKEGLSPKQKALYLGAVTLAFAVYYVFFAPQEPFFRMPFSARTIPITGWWKALYLLFVILYLFFVSNCVNLSDGVDGLCGSLMLVAGSLLALALHLAGPYPVLMEIALTLALGAGAFLWFNWQPAKIFMGDTGSLSLGVGLAAVALWAGIPWIMLLTGFVFVVEGLSSLLQTLYFKLTHGRRIFRMAPLHHHFELGGWSEKQIVFRFSLVALGTGLLALLCL